MMLRPEQAWAISEIFEKRGGVVTFGPGKGKSLISLLIPQIMGWKRPLLLVNAALRDKALKIDIPHLSRHWRMHEDLEIRSYEELSQQSFATYLAMQRPPDGMVCDEVHALKNMSSARTKRVDRLMRMFPETEFVGMSGSPVYRSMMDYGHYTVWALKDDAPVPHSFIERKTWADALDEGIPDWARPEPGALFDFCKEGESARDGFGRRLVESPGFLSSPDLSTNIGLRIMELKAPTIPAKVKEAFKFLRNKNTLPEGEVVTTSLDQLRHAKELFLGFYLRWVWPGGKRDTEWVRKRSAWRRYVRKMTSRSHNGFWLDTERQVATAVEQGLVECREDEEQPAEGGVLRHGVNVYEEWVAIRDARQAVWGGREPPKEAVWLSEYMVDAVEEWSKKNVGIVWVPSIAFMDKLKERGNTCFYAGDSEIEHESGTRSVFAMLAHGTGKNLQMFNKMLFAAPLSSGKAWEQTLGREHRPGQKADEVLAEVYLGCREAWWSFERSRLDAKLIESTIRQRQRLNMATIVSTDEPTALARSDSGDPLWADTGHARLDGDPTDPKALKQMVFPLLTELSLIHI